MLRQEQAVDPSRDPLTQTGDPGQDLTCVSQDRNNVSNDEESMPSRGCVDPSPGALRNFGGEELDPPLDEPKAALGILAGKPLRRAQIFDKGVDASRMQVKIPLYGFLCLYLQS